MITLYPDVNIVLDRLLADTQTTLGDQFVGLYLYGSLASGDFNLHTSDIDFMVVTADQLPGELIAALEVMHEQIKASGLKWAAKLEGSYVPRPMLRRYDPDHPPCPQINESRFYVAPHGSDWIIQRHILREHGVVIVGPPLRPLIDPVQPDDLRGAVWGILRGWWEPMLDNPAWLRDSEYQAFAILSMCRALYTFEHGEIASKPVSARWAQETLGAQRAGVIEKALIWQRGDMVDLLADALDLIRCTLERGESKK